MKELLNEWRKFVNEAEQISEEQKDPEMIAQARLDGTFDAQNAGNRGDKWEGGPYFEFYNDSYNNELDMQELYMQDREGYYDDLEEDLDKGEDYYVRKMTPADGKEYFKMIMSDGNEYLVEYDASTGRSVVFDYEYAAGQDISDMAGNYIQQDLPYDQERFPEPEDE